MSNCTNSDRMIVVTSEEQIMLLLYKGFHVVGMVGILRVDLALNI